MQVALQRPARRPAVARGGRGAGRGAGDRDAVRDQLVVVSGRGGRPGGRGDHVAARAAGRRGYPLVWLGLVLVASFVLILPFVLNFDPEARGIGFVHVRRAVRQVARRHALIYGILIWPLLAAFVIRLREAHAHAGAGSAGAGAAVRRPRLAAGLRRPDRRDAAGGLDGGRHRRRALARRSAAPARFLWILIAGGAALLLIPEIALPARRVRRLGAVPHEHGLQGRLSGVPAARAGRRLRAAVGRRPGCRGAPGRRGRRSPRCCCCSGSSTPTRAATRKHRRLRQRAVAGRPQVAAAALARRPGRDRLAARQRRRRRRRARGLRRRLLGVRPRAHLDLHRPPDRDRLGRPRGPVAARPRLARPPTSRRSTRPPTSRPARRADRPLRRSATSSSGRSSRRPTATPGWPSGTSSGERVYSTRRARRSGSCASALGPVLRRRAIPSSRPWGSRPCAG